MLVELIRAGPGPLPSPHGTAGTLSSWNGSASFREEANAAASLLPSGCRKDELSTKSANRLGDAPVPVSGEIHKAATVLMGDANRRVQGAGDPSARRCRGDAVLPGTAVLIKRVTHLQAVSPFSMENKRVL